MQAKDMLKATNKMDDMTSPKARRMLKGELKNVENMANNLANLLEDEGKLAEVMNNKPRLK